MADLDRLVAHLRTAGAKGTDDGLIYAFGVHFNIEAPSLQAASILRHLRAFILLYDWLKSELRLDSLRRITPFIRPFPSRYARLILHPAYRPNRRILIDDYLKHNPTRNRALDLLPLFAEVDPERVFTAVDDPLVNARPAYHYRMPNSFVGDPDWRLSDEWRSWLVIESLAADPRRLRAMADEYLVLLEQPFGDIFSIWAERSEQCLRELPNNVR
jgi:hypothetical protein